MIHPVVRIHLSEENIEDDYENSDLFVTSDALNETVLLEKTNRVIAHLKLVSRDNGAELTVPQVLKALESEEIYKLDIKTADWIV